MNEIQNILADYTAGKLTLEAANAALRTAGSSLLIDPARNAIPPEDAGRFGLLDTGTGTLDKVEIREGRLMNADVGALPALCIFGGKTYRVHGGMLAE